MKVNLDCPVCGVCMEYKLNLVICPICKGMFSFHQHPKSLKYTTSILKEKGITFLDGKIVSQNN